MPLACLVVCREGQYFGVVVPLRVADEMPEDIEISLPVQHRAENLVGGVTVGVFCAEIGPHPVEMLRVGGDCHQGEERKREDFLCHCCGVKW